MKSLSEILAVAPLVLEKPLKERPVIKKNLERQLIHLINEVSKSFDNEAVEKDELQRQVMIALTVMLANENLEEIEKNWQSLNKIKMFNESSSSIMHDEVSTTIDLVNEAIISANFFNAKPGTSYQDQKKKLEQDQHSAQAKKDKKLNESIYKKLSKMDKAIHVGELFSGMTLTSSMRRLEVMNQTLNNIYEKAPGFIKIHNAGTDFSVMQQMEKINDGYGRLLIKYKDDPFYENHQHNVKLTIQCEESVKLIVRELLGALDFSLTYIAYGITPSRYKAINESLEILAHTFLESLDQPILNNNSYQDMSDEFEKNYLKLANEIHTCRQSPEEIAYRGQEKCAAEEGLRQFSQKKYLYRIQLMDSQNAFVRSQRLISEKSGELQNINKFIFYGKDGVSMEKDTQRNLKISGRSLGVDKSALPLANAPAPGSKEELITILDKEFGENNRANLMNHYDQGPALLLTTAVEQGLRSDHYVGDVPLVILPPQIFPQNIYMRDGVVFRDAAVDHLRISVEDEAAEDNCWVLKVNIKILLWITKDGYIVEGMCTDSALICNAIMQKNTSDSLINIVTTVLDFDKKLKMVINELLIKDNSNAEAAVLNEAKICLLRSIQSQILEFKTGVITFDEFVGNIGKIYRQALAFNNDTLRNAVLSILNQESNELAFFINNHFKILANIKESIEQQANLFFNKKTSLYGVQQTPLVPSFSSASSILSMPSVEESKKDNSSETLKIAINYLAACRPSELEVYKIIMEKKDPATQNSGKYNVVKENIHLFRKMYCQAFVSLVNYIQLKLKEEYEKKHGEKDAIINNIPADKLVPALTEEISRIVERNANINLEILYNNLDNIILISFSSSLFQSRSHEEAAEESSLIQLGQVLHVLIQEKKAHEKLRNASNSSSVSSINNNNIKAIHIDWIIDRVKQMQFWDRLKESGKYEKNISMILDELEVIKNSNETFEKKFLKLALQVKICWDKCSKDIKDLYQNPNQHRFLLRIDVLLRECTQIYDTCHITPPPELNQFPVSNDLLLHNHDITLPSFSELTGELLFDSLSDKIMKELDSTHPLAAHLQHLIDALVSYVNNKIYTPSQAFVALAIDVKRIQLQYLIESKKWLIQIKSEFKDPVFFAQIGSLVTRIESGTLPLPKIASVLLPVSPGASSNHYDPSSIPARPVTKATNDFISSLNSSHSAISVPAKAVAITSNDSTSCLSSMDPPGKASHRYTVNGKANTNTRVSSELRFSTSVSSSSGSTSAAALEKKLADAFEKYKDNFYRSVMDHILDPKHADNLIYVNEMLKTNKTLVSGINLKNLRADILKLLDIDATEEILPDKDVRLLRDIKTAIDCINQPNAPSTRP